MGRTPQKSTEQLEGETAAKIDERKGAAAQSKNVLDMMRLFNISGEPGSTSFTRTGEGAEAVAAGGARGRESVNLSVPLKDAQGNDRPDLDVLLDLAAARDLKIEEQFANTQALAAFKNALAQNLIRVRAEVSPANAKVSASNQRKLAGLDTMETIINELLGSETTPGILDDPEVTKDLGFVWGATNRFLSNFSAANPKALNAQVAIDSLAAIVRKEFAGTALSVQEAKFITRFLATGNDSMQQIMIKLEAARQFTILRRANLAKQTQGTTPLDVAIDDDELDAELLKSIEGL